MSCGAPVTRACVCPVCCLRRDVLERSDQEMRLDETRARASRESSCVVKARTHTSVRKCPHGYGASELCPFCVDDKRWNSTAAPAGSPIAALLDRELIDGACNPCVAYRRAWAQVPQ